MRILAIGDVIGRPGRRAVKSLLPGLRLEYSIDTVVANAENAAGGVGLTPDTARELLEAGIDVLTSGNHIWDHKEIIPHMDGPMPIIRPLNYPPGVPGRGYLEIKNAVIVNLLGRIFIGPYDCPFRAMDSLLASLAPARRVIIVDLHAEATAEKAAMGWHLDGRVSAVFGTHTHIGTVDARVLPQGTAYITDIGMVGPEDSVIGDERKSIVDRFLKRMPHRISVGGGAIIFNAILLDIDDETGKARSIVRLDKKFPEPPLGS